MEFLFFCLIVGILVTIFGIYKIVSYEQLKKNNTKIVGSIVDFQAFDNDVDGVRHTSYLPIIGYYVNDVCYKIKASQTVDSQSKANFLMGQKVELYYNPKKPQNAFEVGSSPGLGYLILGLILLAFPLSIFIYSKFLM